MSQKQYDSSFSFQEEEQENEQMQLMKEMQAMQKEYEKIRLRYQMIRKNKQKHAQYSNSHIQQSKQSCLQPLIMNKPQIKLAQTQLHSNTIQNIPHHHQLQSQQQSFSFQNSNSSIHTEITENNNIFTANVIKPMSISADTFVYNQSKLQSFSYQESYIYGDDCHDKVSLLNKQLPLRQSILSTSNEQSFEFKDIDSIPTANNQGIISSERQKNHQVQQSFRYKSSTDEESFSYQASERSFTSVLDKKFPLVRQVINTKQQRQLVNFYESSQISVNQSQYVEDSFVFNNSQQPIVKDENLNKKQKAIQLSQDGSFEPSRYSNGVNFEYNLREFSFQLPESIHDPFEIKTYIQPIQKQHSQTQYINTTQLANIKPIDHPKNISSNKNSNNLQKISEAFDDQYQSQQEQLLFLKKLVNKLSMRKKISIKEIKRLSMQMKQLAEKNMQLVEIFETGTYELDYHGKGGHIDWTDKYIEKVNSWSTKLLITQLSMTSMQSKQHQQNFFKNVSLPSLQQVTIYFQDLTLEENGFIIKRPDSNASIAFLRYNGLFKRLKTLSLRGQTMVLQVAKNLVDMDFPNLKSLYIGFQSYLTHQIIQILTCTQFSNLPKCTIYIATWDGDINTRFRSFYEKVKFIPLQQGQQQLSNQQLKYRARQLNFNNSQKQSWKQGLLKDLGNYFQNSQQQS